MTTTGRDGTAALPQVNLLQASPNTAFDRITRLAAQVFAVPAAAVSFTDETCQWFVARTGLAPPMSPHAGSPCFTIAETGQALAVPDLASHPEYQSGLLASLGMRFYAGAPLCLNNGRVLGTVCVMGPGARIAGTAELALLDDLAALTMAEIELRHSGRIDPLSGLPNRQQLLDEIAGLAAQNPGQPRLLALIDLARPAELSHILHAVGSDCLDEMVQQDAHALHDVLGRATRLFHVAPTQFALIASPGSEPADLAEHLQHELSRADLGRDALFSTTCTTGLAVVTPGEAPATELLRRAHAALDDARARRASLGLYIPSQDVAFRRAFTLLNDFAGALVDDHSLKLVFQPRLELASGRCVGVEALLRWTHPTLGNVSPGEFVRLVEKTTMARSMMHWVLGKALQQLAAWRDAGLDLQLSVNVSPANLEDDDFADHVLKALADAGLQTTTLELELTESALMDDAGPGLAQLRTLSDAGVCIAIDDFGTGYSSLAYLHRLPANVVKIDQSFIRGLSMAGLDENRHRTLVTAMIGLSHELGYSVVAEGIETQEAADLLRSLDCDEVQGYHFARPMLPGAFMSWFTQRPWVPDNHPARPVSAMPRHSRHAHCLRIIPA